MKVISFRHYYEANLGIDGTMISRLKKLNQLIPLLIINFY